MADDIGLIEMGVVRPWGEATEAHKAAWAAFRRQEAADRATLRAWHAEIGDRIQRSTSGAGDAGDIRPALADWHALYALAAEWGIDLKEKTGKRREEKEGDEPPSLLFPGSSFLREVWDA